MNEPGSGEFIPISAEVSLEDVAAIKVSEAEVGLIGETDVLRQDVKKLNDEITKLREKLTPAMVEDTRKHYPEVKKLEGALKQFFGSKNATVVITFNQENKIHISVTGQDNFAWRGKESKEIKAEIEAKQKEVGKKEDQLVEARKKLCQLPALERSTKAAVARHRLSQSKGGQAILKEIGKVGVPGIAYKK
jgi:hypothetical protein